MLIIIDFNEDFKCDVIDKVVQYCKSKSESLISFEEYVHLFS